MTDSIAAQVEELLAYAAEPLTSPEIARELDLSAAEVDHAIWARPETFAWQPGHRWALNAPKRAAALGPATEHTDARATPLAPKQAVELHAITLTSGVTLRVTQRPIDSASLFTVESRGRELRLVLNSSHPAFVAHPMPFASDQAGSHQRLLELLLEAWALHEDGVPSGEPKRALEETRLMWGRRLAQLLSEGQ